MVVSSSKLLCVKQLSHPGSWLGLESNFSKKYIRLEQYVILKEQKNNHSI